MTKPDNPAVRNPLAAPEFCPAGRNFKAGVLSNPRSGGNKKRGGAVLDVLARWPDVVQREAFTPEGVSQALADFARNGVDLIVINGGDGTVHAALTAIGNEKIFPRPPLLALLCAGTTSMLPRDVGLTGSPAAALPRVLAWAKSPDAGLVVRSRPVLRVLRSPHHPPLYGMFFGAGAICQGIKAFHRRDNPMGWRGELMPAVTMLRLLLAILFKKPGVVPPLLIQAGYDGYPPERREQLMVLITTLERLFIGLRPYWGTENGPLRYTAVGAAPKYLLRVLAALLGSRQSAHAIPENGYTSHNVQEIQLEMAGDFTLDGELYATEGEAVRIAAAGPVRFLCQP